MLKSIILIFLFLLNLHFSYNECTGDTPYSIGNICYSKCPDERPYFNSNNDCVEECNTINDGYYHDYGSGKCKTRCSNDQYEFNYICYNSCPDGTKKSQSGNKCECSGKYVTNDISSDKVYITCINEAACPSDKPYFFDNDKECIDSSKIDSIKCPYIRKLSTSPLNYQCLTECAIDEYKYEPTSGTKYCVTECPINNPYYYNDVSNGKLCKVSCSGSFVDENTKICYDECPEITLYSTGITSAKGKCYFGSKCPSAFPYLYQDKKSCMDDCDCLNLILPTTDQVYYLDEETNECYKDCPTGKFKNTNNKKCVKSCKDNSLKSYNGECYSSCSYSDTSQNDLIEVEETAECVQNTENDKYYYIAVKVDSAGTTVNVNLPSDIEKFYLNKCPDTYTVGSSVYDVYQKDKLCYVKGDNCPTGFYYQESTKKCISCSSSNEGYIVTGDKQCYEICPNSKPYYTSNVCTDTEPTGKKRINGTYEYVDSCPNDYYEFNSICYYNNCPENMETETSSSCKCKYSSYTPSGGKETCLALNELCPSVAPYLNENKECDTDGCKNPNTILRKVSSNPDIFECLSSGSSCETNEFYYLNNNSKKVCVTKCPDDYPYRDSDDTDNGDSKLCRQSCDSTKRYTNEKNHLCYTSCPGSGLNLFNPNANDVSIVFKGICISESSCPSTAPYLFNNTKTCFDDCQKIKSNGLFVTITNIYLNEASNECITSCSLYLSSDEKKCVEQCPNKIEDNKCTDTCAGNYYVYETGKCVASCGGGTSYYKDSRSSAQYQYICYLSCPSDFWYDEDSKKCYDTYDALTYIVENTSKKVISSCSSDYKYNEGGYNFCYKKCPDSAPYYIENGSKTCVKECSGTYNILVESTKRCIEAVDSTNCPVGEFNNICYEKCPDNTKLVSNKCECIDKYYERAIDASNSLIECLKEGDACPPTKPYLNGQECSNTACTDFQREIIVNGVTNYECINSCNSDEYKYSSNSIKKCVSRCPEAAPYHVLLSDTSATNYATNHKSCMTRAKCKEDNKYFIDEANYICYDKCPGLATIDETIDSGDMKPSKCVLGNDCPSSYPYLYETYCLSDCSFTNKYTSSFFNNFETKLEATTNKCVRACSSPIQYYDVKTKTCVVSCRDDQYISGNDCYNTEFCKDGNEKVISGTHKCVNDCPTDYPYQYDKYCYQKCPEGTLEVTDENICVTNCTKASNDKKYINFLTNKCSTCGVSGEYYVPNVSPLICYSKCPDSAPYYLSQSNKCYSTGCPVDDDEYSNYKYLNPETNECMESCSGYEFNNVCYSDSCPDLTVSLTNKKCECAYNYYEKNSLNICLNVDEPCPSSFPYIRTNRKCDISCADDENYIRKVSSYPVNYECLKSCNNSEEFVYKDTSNKKYCLKKCPEEAQFNLANTSGERICGKSCTDNNLVGSDEYYSDEINHLCYSICPGLMTINEDENKKDKCISDIYCPSYKPYLYKNKFCLADCASTTKTVLGTIDGITYTTDSPWILDKSTNKCIENTDSCKFTDESGACVEKCGNSQFTYVDGKKCYDKCPSTSTLETDPKYTYNELKQCVTDCSTVGYYIIPGDYKCYKTCPSGYNTDDYKLICYASGCSNTDGEAKILKVSYNKCLKSCNVPKNKNYLQVQEGYLYGDTLCLDKCPNDKPYIIKDSNICYAKNDSALSGYLLINGTNEYIQEDSGKCPTGYYLFNNLCYTSCPKNSEYDKTYKICVCSFKYLKTQDPLDASNTNYLVCLGPNEFCPNQNQIYVKDNLCVSSDECTEKKRQIFSNPINYECIDSCESYEFEYNDYCLKQCPENAPYHIFNQNKCYSDCAAAGTDTVKYYTDKVNYICYSKCPGLSTMDESGNELIPKECLHQAECSQSMYLYDDKNLCLTSCKNAAKSPLGVELVPDEDKKKCGSSCGSKFTYENSGQISCADVCPKETFIYLKTCISQCNPNKYLDITKVCLTEDEAKNYYYVDDDQIKYYESCPLTNSSGADLYQDDTKKCKTDCSSTTTTTYKKKSIHKCVACTKPADLNSIKDEEGFIISGECVEKCPSYSPYYVGNECKTEDEVINKTKIEDTNEYINDTEDCPDLYYKFNKKCYKNKCPENSYYDKNDKVCKCSFKFTFINESYSCFPEATPCPSDYPFFEPDLTLSNKGCVDGCGDKKIKKFQTSTYTYSYECVDDCPFGDFVYTDNSLNRYCVEECPEDKRYHVFRGSECRSDCSEHSGDRYNYYTGESGFICYIDCERLKILSTEEGGGKKGKCISDDECPNDLMLYVDENLCVSDCAITGYLTGVFNIPSDTYLYDDGRIKQCLTKCSITLDKRYISGRNCVEKCPDDEKIYNFKCESDCTNLPTGNAGGYYIAETKECTKNKPTGYYTIYPADQGTGEGSEDSKKYFKECPETNSDGVKLYYKKDTTSADNNYCVSCKIGTEYNNGFYIENDPDRICYSSCPNEVKYHIKDDNKCVINCASAYPYQYTLMDTNECVEECPSDYYQANYECYKNDCPQGFIQDGTTNICICDTRISGSKFYKSYDSNNNEILICITDATVNCPTDKPYLTEEKECVADCSSDYKIKDEEEKKCYASSCPNGKYLKVSLNKCVSDCKIPYNKENITEDEGYYITKVTSVTSQKCYDVCPDGNVYHNAEENKCISDCGTAMPYLIMGKDECVKVCPDGYYLFNKVCYEGQCPEDTELDSVNLECKCKYKYTKSSDRYECLAENETCPLDKNYYDETKECTNSCNKKLRKSSTDADDYECLNECFENEFLYNDGNHNYCVATCPYDKAYHLPDTINCITCNSPNYVDETNKICYSTCPNLHTIDETGTSTISGECLQGNKCPIVPIIYYYYEKKKACISSCSLTSTKRIELGGEKSYTTSEIDPLDNTLRVLKCVTDCSTNLYKKLTDTVNNACVEKCGENDENVKFLYQKKCYSSCGKETGGASLTPDLYLEDTKECVTTCPDGYYAYYYETSKGICYKKCPSFSSDTTPVELFTHTEKRTCISCTIPQNPSALSESEGYKVFGDTTKTCYETCPNAAIYYDSGNNFCFDGGCRSSNNPDPTKLFTIYNDGSVNGYVCYTTCQDAVGNDLMTEDNQCIKGTICPISHPYLYSGVCYKDKCPSDYLKTYEISKGIYECQSSCTKDQYIEGDNCVTNCGSDYPYKVKNTATEPGICFTAEEKCSTTINQYYDESNKICSADCSKYKIETDSTTGRSKISIKGTCLSSCPEDFPYSYENTCYKSCPSFAPFIDESVNKFTCLKNCAYSTNKFEYNGNKCVSSCTDKNDKYYIEYTESETVTRKVCVNKCTSPQQYYFASNGKCLPQCEDTNLSLGPSYYNPITFECFDSCSSIYTYQFHLEEKLSACLSNCDPNTEYGYYYESEKKCISECDKYYASFDSHICVQSCGSKEFVIYEQNKCVTSCPANYPYQVTKNEGNNIFNYCFSECKPSISGFESYQYISNTTKKCTTKCEGTEKYLTVYSYPLGNVCYSKCPDLKPYFEVYDSTNGIYKCLSSCDDSNNNKFHDKNNYECFSKCVGDKKYYVSDTNTCIDSCPSSFPYEIEADYGLECTDKCTGYLSGNICSRTSCDLKSYPYYVKALKQCFIYCPDDFPYRKISEDETKYIYECVKDCGSEYLSDGECVSRCPQDKNYIGKNNICKNFCEDEDGNYYSNMDPINTIEGKTYDVYTCSSECSLGNFLYHTIREYECFIKCQDEAPYKAYDYICYSSCKENKKYPFSIITDNNEKLCVPSCLPYDKQYYDEDYNCIPLSSCTGTKTIDQTNKCVEKCNITSEYKFKDSVKNYYFCQMSCSSTSARFYKPEFECLDKCKENDYVREDGECEKSCDPDSFATFGVKNANNEIVCEVSCPKSGDKYYYLANKLCISKCDTNDFVLEGTSQCVTECNEDYPYKYYKTNGDNTYSENTCVRKCTGTKQFTLSTGECAKECPTDSPYYLASDKKCLYKCPEGFSKMVQSGNNYQCNNECGEKKFILNNKCVDHCDDIQKYYFEKTKECLYTCGSGFYKNGDICVDICPNNLPYDNGSGTCDSVCPTDKNYYIKDIEPEEPDRQIHCLRDCPITHPFFISDGKGAKACYEVCPNLSQIYHVRTYGKIAKECKTECTENNSGPGKYVGDNGECLKHCPNSKHFYLEGQTNNIKCLEKCPIDTYYSPDSSDKNLCRKTCSNYIYEKEKTCLSKCESNQYTYEDINSNQKYCLDECDGELSITPENECVKECDSKLYLMKNPDLSSNKCICEKLYYYEAASGIMKCLNPTINDCRLNTDNDYIIPIKNSEECLRRCKTIFSSDGYCLEKYECPSNSVLTTNATDYTQYCKCKYKFYKNEFNKDICLDEDEDCPDRYNYVVYGTNECVVRCIEVTDHQISHSGYCIKQCPEYSEPANQTNGTHIIKYYCKCKYKWILNEENVEECLGPDLECPQSKPLLVNDTKQCIEKCPKEFPIIYNNKCLSQCNAENADDFEKVAVLEADTSLKKYGNYTCQCKNLWYYDASSKVICSEIKRTGSGSCPKITNIPSYMIYLVKDTGQCTFSCPELYPYKFNFDCFSDCEINGNSYYKDNLKTKSNTECQCKSVFRIENDSGKDIISCIKYEECDVKKTELYIVETEECIKGDICPYSYPVLFNRKCYEGCPENSNPDDESCLCLYLWYKTINPITGVIETICMKEEEKTCPETKPYFNTDTNECTKDYSGFNYLFNKKGYANGCPFTTKESSIIKGKTKLCVCDEDYGPWHIDNSTQNDFYVCALDECPNNKTYQKSDTKECLFTCKNLAGYVVFKKICYPYPDPGCPGNSKLLDLYSNICKYDPLLESKNFTDFHSKFENDILYYYDDSPDGGNVYEGFGVSTQLVGIGKNVEYYKNVSMKGNLTYIDFGKCLEKIFETYDLDDDDKIILLKFDSVNIPEYYLIHPVEYEVYSPKTGQKIDLSLCDINDIVISYPIYEHLYTDDKSLRHLADAKKIRQLFLLAKKINDAYSYLDAFNSKSDLYNDLCQECAIDGRDLILRDRVPYLYPENASLCESNCTFLYTDFDRERVNCRCTYKLKIIMNRKQNNYVANFTQEEIDSIQQGPTNFPILKCIKKFDVSHNGGFFYMTVVLVFEIILCVLCFSLGYSIFEQKISLVLYGKKEEIVNVENDKNKKRPNEIEVNTENKNLKIDSSERNINIKTANPPKNAIFSRKEEVYVKKDEDNLEIKIDQNQNQNQKKNDNPSGPILYKRNIANDLADPYKLRKNDPYGKYFQDDIFSKYEKTSSEANFKRDIYEDEDLLTILRKEKRNKDLQFETAIIKDKESTLIIVLAFIVDKIYLTKSLLFTRTYDIFSANVSLYILYHVLVLILITMFFDLKRISKMFFERKYPDIGFYLLYGLICNVITWIIYRLLGCLIKNNNRVLNFIARWKIKNDNRNKNYIYNNNNDNDKNTDNDNQMSVESEDSELAKAEVEYRYKRLKRGVIARLIIYYIIEWAILLFSFFYLSIFSSVYVSTKNEVFKTYGISLFEVFIIKIVYAVILGCLRSLALYLEHRQLYIIVKFLDFYFS